MLPLNRSRMKICVFCPNWVGDAVMATPALRALRHHFDSAYIVGVMRPVVAHTLEGLPHLDDWCVWDPRSTDMTRRSRTVLKSLRQDHIDLAVLFTNSFRTAAMAWLSRASRRLGYRRDRRGWLLTNFLEPPRDKRYLVPIPAIDYYLNLAYYLGCPKESYNLDLATTPSDERAADTVWRTLGLCHAGRVVVLNPGAAYGSAKRWPPSYFGELARSLVRLPGTEVLVLCGPAERPMAREIVKRSGRLGVHTLADFRVSIGLSKACLRRAGLMITTDSGPRHFAAAFDIPTITLFGPTHQQWSETYFAKAGHLQKNVPCGPCQLRECPLDHRCMRDLGPTEVFKTAKKYIERFCEPLAA